MISFLQQVGEDGEDDNKTLHFHVCLSSRHYPHISIDRGLSLTLEGQEEHNEDIAKYVVDKLRIRDSEEENEIKELLREKASGVFMWVVLVVDILNKEYDRGHIIGLRNRLQDIPSDLHELFRDILWRDIDDCDKDALLLCIQWVLFGRNPLTPTQFYIAIRSGGSPKSLREWGANEITYNAIKRFILDTSKGLVETTLSDYPTVQFIHESVVDFLLESNGLAEIWGDIGMNFQGLSHERLRDCCLKSINIGLATTYMKSNTNNAGRPPSIHILPLLDYALRNVFYHADCAERSGITQRRFLEKLQLSKLFLLDSLYGERTDYSQLEMMEFLSISDKRNSPTLVGAYLSAVMKPVRRDLGIKPMTSLRTQYAYSYRVLSMLRC
jgi:hypothetical protein